jgi:hypothetical protein
MLLKIVNHSTRSEVVVCYRNCEMRPQPGAAFGVWGCVAVHGLWLAYHMIVYRSCTERSLLFADEMDLTEMFILSSKFGRHG